MNNIYTKINNMQRHSNSYKRTVKRMTAFLLVVIVVLCAVGCKSTKSGGTVIPGSAVTPARKQGNISDITGNNKNRTLVGLLVAEKFGSFFASGRFGRKGCSTGKG